MLTLGRTCKFIPPPWYKGGGWTPALEFLICCSISKRFYLQRKAFNGGTAGGGSCDVINNGRLLGRHLGFYQEFEIRIKPQEMAIFFVLEMKNNT